MTPRERRIEQLKEARKRKPEKPTLGMTWDRAPNITKERLLKAIPGTGGNATALRRRLGVKNNVSVWRALHRPEWQPDVLAAWEKEKEAGLFAAEQSVRHWAEQRSEDLASVSLKASTWLLERRHEGYKPKTAITLEGGPNPILVNSAIVEIDPSTLPVEVRRQLLTAISPAPKKLKVKVRKIVEG